ncbi:hypothetical protein NQ317_015777 [Molorchus minor]|uniref:Uncharacterized protein n=1 Tax=Molorchus minor TaxID=1323400 RepID=A0ABQ9K250_9CUCU|nr:hypothetical protein NQ317_015777 [Molorchus minor]
MNLVQDYESRNKGFHEYTTRCLSHITAILPGPCQRYYASWLSGALETINKGKEGNIKTPDGLSYIQSVRLEHTLKASK